MIWPFETRARRYPRNAEQDPPQEGGQRADYTDSATAALVAQSSGVAVEPGALALAEACAGLWERALSSATVEPMNNRLAGLSPAFLAVAGRSLAVKGNLCARIVVEGSRVLLIPASVFDLMGGADPDSWTYRLDMVGPTATETIMLPAAGVVHFRCGASASAPWRGVAPLNRATATAGLATAVEKSITTEARLPIGRLGVVYGSKKADGFLDFLKCGGYLVAGGNADRGLQQEPSTRHRPQTYGPEPNQVMQAVRTDTGRDICAAFGVPPGLFAERGDGAGQREAWRRFWLGTVQPLARMIESELRAKLDPAAAVILDALRASDEDGRSRAVARRAQAYKVLRDAGIDATEARRIAGIE